MKIRLVFPVLLLLASPLAAQRDPAAARPPGADRRQQLEMLLLQRFTQRAANELQLNTAQRARLVEIVRTNAAERRNFNQAGNELRRRMVAATRSGNVDESVFTQLLQEQNALRERDAELWKREQAQLGELLTPRQHLQFFLLWQRLQEEARSLLLQRGLGPGGAPPPL